jgi:glycosyltransferase involved in cell wall biosynthesis
MRLAYVQLSVLIDTYNHERLIAKAISSVLEQDYPESQREMIVVDDSSTDHTAEIVRSFAQKNGGQASAFNTGIQSATAK